MKNIQNIPKRTRWTITVSYEIVADAQDATLIRDRLVTKAFELAEAFGVERSPITSLAKEHPARWSPYDGMSEEEKKYAHAAQIRDSQNRGD
jgi:hypothetical protein